MQSVLPNGATSRVFMATLRSIGPGWDKVHSA